MKIEKGMTLAWPTPSGYYRHYGRVIDHIAPDFVKVDPYRMNYNPFWAKIKEYPETDSEFWFANPGIVFPFDYERQVRKGDGHEYASLWHVNEIAERAFLEALRRKLVAGAGISADNIRAHVNYGAVNQYVFSMPCVVILHDENIQVKDKLKISRVPTEKSFLKQDLLSRAEAKAAAKRCAIHVLGKIRLNQTRRKIDINEPISQSERLQSSRNGQGGLHRAGRKRFISTASGVLDSEEPV